MNVLERIHFLRQEVDKHNHAYYVLDTPFITDMEFDALLKELIILEKNNPHFFDKNSPTNRVGGSVLSGFTSYKHKYQMLSLANTYSAEELLDFDKRVKKLTHNQFKYVCELKFDGVSISLTYRDGKLYRALTRGDGEQGDDVTESIKTIKSIPLVLTGNYPNNFEIRGEIFINIKDFEKLNSERLTKGLDQYSNPRNTASGSIKLLDTKEVSKRPLDCYLYYVIGENLPSSSHFDNLNHARNWGFKVPDQMQLCNNIDDVILFVNKWDKLRHSLPFEIDGIVIKVDDTEIQNSIGNTSKFPRWAISYKYQAERAETVLNSITYQVGRTGAITPVANLEPVLLSGTFVKRASLHNEDQITKLDIRVGDSVFIEKGGEIIPKVVSVDLKKRTNEMIPIKFINSCPSCGSLLKKNIGDAKHYCLNYSNCLPQIVGSFSHFISRKAMNIDGLGNETIELLVQNKLIKKFSDLYYLTREKLIHLDRFADKSVDNLLNAINNSKEIEFNRALYGLGIRYVGISVSKILCDHFNDIDSLIKADFETLISVDGIGDKIAESIISWFFIQQNIDLINELKLIGINFSNNTSNVISDVLSGKKIIVSGTFINYSRDEIKKIIENHQGINVSSISKKTTFVLAGNDMGPSKRKKAEMLDIPIISEEKFFKMLNK